KMAITARLAGKEVYRHKLRWFDLRRAHYRLGRRAYERRLVVPNTTGTIERLDDLQKRIETLGQSETSGSSFKEKLNTAVRRSGKIMKIQMLKFRRKRLLRKLGCRIAEEQVPDNSLAAETGQVKAASEKQRLVDAEIQSLAAHTYVWARRPLLIG